MTHVLLDDDPANKSRLFLALLGVFVPDLWKRAALRKLTDVGNLGPFASFAEAAASIDEALAGEGEGRKRLARARSLRDLAAERIAGAKYPEALDAAAKARTKLVEAYCTSKKPLAGEHRAFWCHSAFGVEGMTWDEAVSLLAKNGFTAVLPNMLWGGAAFFASEVLPVAAGVGGKSDPIDSCLKACTKHGVECHVWKVNWNMGRRTPATFRKRMKKEGRTQVRFDGTPEDGWLCPSHPANRALEIASMVEVARKYAVHGLHFDYIRYPGLQSCYCPGCQSRFEEVLGSEVPHWPRGLKENPGLWTKWLGFRRENITAVVASVSEAARKARPGIRISAAVFRNWPTDRDNIGQDWKIWCDRGYLDFVCPMDYTEDTGHFAETVARQKRWAGKVPCYPGIGLSCWKDRTDVLKLIDQIEVTRRLCTGGFTIFQLAPTEAETVLPLLGLGMTRKRE
jgi:uncharacterized lipoprotein YddW (UPF0748 family)